MKIDKKFYTESESIQHSAIRELPDYVKELKKDIQFCAETGKERRPDYSSYKERLNRSRAPETKTEE